MKFLILLLLMVFTLISEAKLSKTFSYYDIDLKEELVIHGDNTISWMIYRDPVVLCDSGDDYVCLKSGVLNFGIPKKIISSEWVFNKTYYCITERLYDKKDKSYSIFINFGYTESCEEIAKTGYKLLFNTKHGLRFLNGKNHKGFPLRVLATDNYGFGGRNKVRFYDKRVR